MGAPVVPVRQIIHLDMDAFYASIEVLDSPSLKGKPVIVGGPRRRGVVAAASYEARRFGVRSAQPVKTAMRLCPQGIVLPLRISRYKEISNNIFELFHCFTPLVEPLSLDEAFLDVTDSLRLYGPAEGIATHIKQLIRDRIGLTASAGVAPCKSIAKIASGFNKPDGLTVVPPDRVTAFLDPLPIGRLWGAGKKLQKELSRLGIRTVEDLRRVPVEVMEKKFGKQGIQMSLLSRGIDPSPVNPDRELKSLGSEETYDEDVVTLHAMKTELLALARRVTRRARRHGTVGKTVTLKIKYHDFSLATRSVTLPQPTDDVMEVYERCCRLLETTVTQGIPVRLLGIYLSQLTRLSLVRQLSLLDCNDLERRKKNLNHALDRICDKFGEDAIIPGSLLPEADCSDS